MAVIPWFLLITLLALAFISLIPVVAPFHLQTLHCYRTKDFWSHPPTFSRGSSRKIDALQHVCRGDRKGSQPATDFAHDAEFMKARVCILENPVDSTDDSMNSGIDNMGIFSRLATKTSLPRCPKSRDLLATYTHCLCVVPYESTYAIAVTSVQKNSSPKRLTRRNRMVKKTFSKPYYIDLCASGDTRLGKRTTGQTGKDLLLKAVAPSRSASSAGSQEQTGAIVYDLTAGFGQDSVVIANGGACKVHMVERDPIVAILLEDALRRLSLLAQSGDVSDSRVKQALMLSQKLSMQVGEGIDVATNISSQSKESGLVLRPDVCYLDPMFPPRTKSAAVKKNMQVLHELLGSQNMEKNSLERTLQSQLLDAAIEAARMRVVVKRPINAPPLGGRKPSYDIRGTVNRWDVYVSQPG